ncbi:MAG: penicillin-binding transpeptidase domain-containing protein [candidate division Zixibacteria bacterium]|nr:penicillin-binding transpeptidase domain-containing protein [candidate division Zixibacteria bacterium]
MKRTRQENIRLGILFCGIVLFFGVVIARLVQLQIFLAPKYSEMVARQSSGSVEIPAERGVIFDRNGTVVAKNVIGTSLCARPKNEAEVAEAARFIDKLFTYKSGTALKEFALSPLKFRYIKRNLNLEQIVRLKDDIPAGLFLRNEPLRQYPFGLVGKQILGFTDIDNNGQSGFELAYDSILTGIPGKADFQRDGLSKAFRISEQALVKPIPGRGMVLTIDWQFQEIVEQELRAAVDSFKIKSGMAVFLDCTNGDILAMAHFDKSETNPERPTKLKAISDQFEPGSSAKAFTAAAALDAHTIRPFDLVYCEKGAWRLGRKVLHDAKQYEYLTFTDVIAKSSNIGVGKVAVELGGEELYQAFLRFGLGTKIKCGLPGETRGSLPRPNRWSEHTTATLAMGHAVAVNALQMATAFAAIANGGDLLHPRLIQGEVDHTGLFTKQGEREVVGRAFEPETRAYLHGILRAVVEHGTGKKANSPQVAIAGKTGTPQLIDQETGAYSHNRYLGCFAGFFPYEKPVIAGIVVLEEFDRETEAGATAAPTFGRIAERFTVANPDIFTVPERTLHARTTTRKSIFTTPDFTGQTLFSSHKLAASRGITLRCSAAEGTVIWQFPPAERPIHEGENLLVVVRESDGTMRLADLQGLSIQAASAYLSFIGMDFLFSGSGSVFSQSILAGELALKESLCRIQCRPKWGVSH